MERCPEYVPAAVWRFYRELALNERDRDQIARLFGRDMALTWRSLAKQIGTDDGATMDWRRLFDLLYTLRLTFDPGARDAMQRAKKLLPEIAAAAESLAAMIRDYQALSEAHQITAPFDLYHLGALIRIAKHGRRDDLDDLDLPGKDVSLINPATLIEELAISSRLFKPGCSYDASTHVHDSKYSRISAWVRHFDARWKDRQRRMTARFDVSNADLARIASAVLRLDVTREAVKQARVRAKPQDEPELFVPD